MKKVLIILSILYISIGCQSVPECQKYHISDLSVINQTDLKLEVMLEMRDPDGDYHYGNKMLEPGSIVTYKEVKEGHIRLSSRIYDTDQWFIKDTYNVRCLDHEFIWSWDDNLKSFNLKNE